MKAIVLLVLVIAASPAMAQTKPSKATRDVCAPIGKTANGQLVYAMACDMMPTPPPPSPPVAAAPPPPEPEVERSGIFGFSYTRKPPSQ